MQTLSNRNMRLRGPMPSGNGGTELGDANFPALKPLDSYRGTSAEQWVSSQNADAGQNQVITYYFHFILNLTLKKKITLQFT